LLRELRAGAAGAVCTLSAVALCLQPHVGHAQSSGVARPFPGSESIGSSPQQHEAHRSPFDAPAAEESSSLFGGSSLFDDSGPQPDYATSLPPARTAEVQSDDLANPIRQQSYTSDSPEDFLGQPVVDVQIKGNSSIPTYAIERLITETRPGRTVIAEQIRKDKTTLINTRWFLSVREQVTTTEDGPIVVFEVIERPILRSVDFVGNEKFDDDRLSRETGLVAGHGFDVSANHESVSRIRELYREKGYIHAKVELQKGQHPDDRDVVIAIEEGPKVAVRWISFEGNEFCGDAVLKTKLSTKSQWFMLFGGTYQAETIQNDVIGLRAYYEGLGFFDVNIEARERISDDGSKVHLVFEIHEGPRYRVRNIMTAGNAVLSREKLMADLKLKPGDYFNTRFLQADAQGMKDMYDLLGRPFAEVQPVPRFLKEPGVLDLIYEVNEDQVFRIGRINVNIRGDQTHTRTDVVLNRINRYLKPGQIAKAKDIQAARAVVSTDPIFDREDPPNFNIRRVGGDDYYGESQIARGQDVPVSFRVGGNLRPTAASVQELFNAPEAGRNLWPDKSDSGLFNEAAGSATAPAQHAERSPAPPASPPPERAVSYLSPVERGRRVNPTERQARQEVVYARQTEADIDYFFRGQSDPLLLDSAPGSSLRAQSMDPSGLPDPQNYLYGVSPQGDPFGTGARGPGPAPGFVDIDIDVTEGRTGRLMFGAGVNSDAGLVGSFVLQEDNLDLLAFPRSWSDVAAGRAFRGGGQSFRLEAVPGVNVSRYNISWRTPYFLGTDFSFGVDGFYYNRYYDNWTEDRLGSRLSVGYIINRHWTIGSALRVENVEFRDFPNIATTPSLYTDVAGSNLLTTAQIRLAHDTRDSAFLPSKGHFAEISYEQAFGEFNYPKVDLSASQYFTLYERPDGMGKHILEFRGQTTWTGSDTPVFERLYAGGFQSFRGFEFRGVAPRQNGFRIGGEFLAVGTAEYVFPITAGDGLRGVLFTDVGTVDTEVEFDEFRMTAGFGLRVTVPAMGPAPLAFDFAFPIFTEALDDEQLFSFYVGTTF
jgi:outer membrane protein insertion porin family